MAKVFIPRGQDGVELCQPVNESDYDSINLLVNGTPRSEEWTPLAMELIHEDNGTRLRRSSSPWLGKHALIFRSECFDVIGEYLKKHGELLLADSAESELYFFNPMNVSDSLNEEKSKIKRLKSGGIMTIESYIFNDQAIKDVHVFKIPNMQASPTFVSQAFVDRWCESELTGLDFELVWDCSGPAIVRNLMDQLKGKLSIRKGK